MSLSITHTAAEGTLIDGNSRGDGSAEILKRHGWRWGGSIRCWYVPRSRDRAARRREIDATADDDTYRSAAEVEATTAVRQEERATRLADSADRKAATAEAADAAARRAHEALPPMGDRDERNPHARRRCRRTSDRGRAAANTRGQPTPARCAAAAHGDRRRMIAA